MKRYLILLLSLLLFVPAITAQNGKNNDKAKMREDLQKFKVDFLAKEMNLSEKEKADFAPLYVEYDNERRKAGAEAWKFERELKKKKNEATQEDYKKLSDLQQAAREKDNEVVKKYDARFESFLNAKQIYTMHKGEEKFFEKMKEMRKKQGSPDHKHKGQGPRNTDRND